MKSRASLLVLSIGSVLAWADDSSSSFQASALQTGPDSLGSSYAAAAYYNAADQSIWVVGSTYGTTFSPDSAVPPVEDFEGGCFFASLDTTSESIQWRRKQTLAMSGVQQACTNLLIHSQRLLVTGYAQQGSVLNNQYEPGAYLDVSQFGMILDVVGINDSTVPLALQGGFLNQESTVSYPISIHTQAGDDYAYVLSMESHDDIEKEEASAVQEVVQDPARFFRYGANRYGVVVTKLSLNAQTSSVEMSSENTEELQVMDEAWRRTFSTNDGSSVHASGILKLSDDVLVAVGTTSGHGNAFGTDTMNGGDLDGFIVKLSPSTGSLVGGSDDPSNLASARLQSVNQHDDWVSGLCHNPRDSSSVYVVGATKGRMNPDAKESFHVDSVQAFIMKVNVYTLTPTWIRQLAAPDSSQKPSSVRGASCAVTPDGGSVYFGGIVEKGSVLELSGTQKSFGGDDIFVAKVDASTGALKFIRQLGSEKDDELAMRGGLVTDAAGNAVVVGNSYGSIYRVCSKEEYSYDRSDVFVATVGSFSGKVVLPVEPPNYSTADDNTGDDDGETNDGEQQNPNTQATDGAAKLAGLLVIVFGVVIVGMCYCCIVRKRREHEVATDRQHVLTYLGDFDVEDVDLKHSATGGWHCSYAGPLAHGINNKSRFRNSFADAEHEEDIFSPLTQVSIYTDSLFMHESDHPRLQSAADMSNGSLVNGHQMSFTESLSRKSEGRGGWGRDII